MGSLYLRGKTWWMKYHVNGKPVRVSTGTTKKTIAKEVLLKIEFDIAQGKTPFNRFADVTFEDAAELLIQDYKINNKKSLVRTERSVSHLKKSFKGVKIPQITSPAISKHIELRLSEKAANASINRELSALKRMLNLGAEQTPPIVDRVPKIKMLEEDNVRQGFFEHDEFLEIRDALPDYLYGVVSFGYKYGWRSEEIKDIKWSQVDRTLWTVRIEGRDTKNKQGRTVYLDQEMKEIFQILWSERKIKGRLLPHVFLNMKGDEKLKSFRKTWIRAFTDTGIEYRIFHDLRRTAIRNMVRSGIPENVAMKISGHKTRSIFDRYDIVNDRDLINATRMQEEYMKNFSADTNPDTIANLRTQKSP